MLIADEIRKCVVFLGYRWTDSQRLAGTAFIVSVAFYDKPISATYLVTAKHVIDSIRAKSIDETVYVRLNLANGTTVEHPIHCSKWLSHATDTSIDVCVSPFGFDYHTVSHLAFDTTDFATSSTVQNENIGIGSDVFIAGLFSNHAGITQNIPIIRTGNIAAVPEEPIATKLFGNIRAYLLEARSIGGLSGSPVFVHTDRERRTSVGNRKHNFYLLGLIHGHFDVPEVTVDIEDSAGSRSGNINVGISIAVPADSILQVLDQPEVVQAREADARAWQDENQGWHNSILSAIADTNQFQDRLNRAETSLRSAETSLSSAKAARDAAYTIWPVDLIARHRTYQSFKAIVDAFEQASFDVKFCRMQLDAAFRRLEQLKHVGPDGQIFRPGLEKRSGVEGGGEGGGGKVM